jgi:hypothetical protein
MLAGTSSSLIHRAARISRRYDHWRRAAAAAAVCPLGGGSSSRVPIDSRAHGLAVATAIPLVKAL